MIIYQYYYHKKYSIKMPPKTYTVGSSTKRTVHLTMPKKSDGTIDNRYVAQQFTKNNGTRDMRTTLTQHR